MQWYGHVLRTDGDKQSIRRLIGRKRKARATENDVENAEEQMKRLD